MKKTISLLTIVLLSTMVLAAYGPGNIENKEDVQGQLQNRIMLNAENLRIGENTPIRTRLRIDNESDTDRLQIRLSNGRNAEIGITPEDASMRVLKKLKMKNCEEERNCTIELKEVGEGENARLAYEARAQKTFRLFGIFKSQKNIITQIDAETGEEISTSRPWWSWMASEKNS